MCNKCESCCIKSIETWEDKIAKLKMDIMDKISKLHPVIGLPVETLRKRQLHEIVVGEPPEKCQHITSESCTPLHVSNVGMQLPSMQSPSPVVPSLTTTTAETVASSSTASSSQSQYNWQEGVLMLFIMCAKHLKVKPLPTSHLIIIHFHLLARISAQCLEHWRKRMYLFCSV